MIITAVMVMSMRAGKLSARWPGDAYLFARRFSELLAVSSDGGRTWSM